MLSWPAADLGREPGDRHGMWGIELEAEVVDESIALLSFPLLAWRGTGTGTRCAEGIEAFGCNPSDQSDRAIHGGCFRYYSVPRTLPCHAIFQSTAM